MLVRQRPGATIDARILDVRRTRREIDRLARKASDAAGLPNILGRQTYMHSVMQFMFWQLMTGMTEFVPEGCMLMQLPTQV
jgi:hypothetical protein